MSLTLAVPALTSRRAEEIGLASNRIVLSCKVSNVQDLISASDLRAPKAGFPCLVFAYLYAALQNHCC